MQMRYAERNNLLPVQQRGVALVVALVFLLAMTAIGVSSFVGSTLQERMVNSGRQSDLATQAAISAVRAGEAWLSANIAGNSANLSFFNSDIDCQGLYQPYTLISEKGTRLRSNPVFDYQANFANGFNYLDDNEWSIANSRGVATIAANLTVKPARYFIELVVVRPYPDNPRNQSFNSLNVENSPSDFTVYFKIVGVGWGRDENIASIVESSVSMVLSDNGAPAPAVCPAPTPV